MDTDNTNKPQTFEYALSNVFADYRLTEHCYNCECMTTLREDKEHHDAVFNDIVAAHQSSLDAAVREARLIELDLLEQAINGGLDMHEYKLWRQGELTQGDK